MYVRHAPFLPQTAASFAPSADLASQAQTKGVHDWSWSAVHGNQAVPSRETLPSSEISFADVLDTINPLQHIPIVSSLYQAATGDTIKAPAQVIGGLLFGGPIGLVAGLVSAGLQEVGVSPARTLSAALSSTPSQDA